MKNTTSRCLVSVLITLMMVVTATQPIVGSSNITDEVTNVDDELSNGPSDSMQMDSEKSIFYDNSFNNIDYQNIITQKGSKFVKVIIATTDINEVALVLSKYAYKGNIGSKSSNSRGIAFPVLEVPSDALCELAELPNVLGIFDYKEPINNQYDEEKIKLLRSIGYAKSNAIEGGVLPNANSSTFYHGAEAAWDNGYTGKDINVATIGSGVDFGHFELVGRQAVIMDDYVVTGEVVTVDTAGTGANLAMPEYYQILPGYKVYANAVEMTVNTDYTMSSNGTIDFLTPITAGTSITADYTYRSPYYHMPIAFDVTSLSNYLEEDLPSGISNPGDTWYANMTSTDFTIYHTVIIDGSNDFWDESNLHDSADDVYPISETTERVGRDDLLDMKREEFDLESFLVASDDKYWYIGFNVTPEVEADNEYWKRSVDARYGIYLDTNATPTVATDPIGNYITTPTEPEFALYLYHRSVDWGVVGTITEWEIIEFNATADIKRDTSRTSVNWGVNQTGVWTQNMTTPFEYGGAPKIKEVGTESDLMVWTKNNTIDNATLFIWNGASWYECMITDDQPYNHTAGINVNEGSSIWHDAVGVPFLNHNGVLYPILSNETAEYYVENLGGYSTVELEILKGEQEFKDEFVEFSLPKEWLEGVDDMNALLFSTGANKSCPQDTCPPNLNVSFDNPIWGIVDNETVFGPSIGGESGPFFLDYDNVLVCTIIVDNNSVWQQLSEGTDYTINYTSGELNLTGFGLPLGAGITIYAEYDYANILTVTNYSYVGAPKEYIVDVDNISKSGVVHIGLHPDKNFVENHYGRPVAVILTDYYTSGVYDTIFIDLDNDKNFSDERPMQEYGAYNESLMIGLMYGTIRYDNGTILHNGTYYEMFYRRPVEVLNEWLVSNYVSGEDTNFQLINGNISVAPTLQKTTSIPVANETVYGPSTGAGNEFGPLNLANGDVLNATLIINRSGTWIEMTEGPDYELNYTSGEIILNDTHLTFEVVNETVYGPSTGNLTEYGPFYLNNSPVINCSLYLWYETVGWFPLSEGADYLLNYSNGEINLTGFPVWPLDVGMTFFAYYNHTGPMEAGWTYHAEYNYTGDVVLTVGTDFSIDMLNGTLSLLTPLILGDDLLVQNYTYFEIGVVQPYDSIALIDYNSQDVEIELRDWVAFKDLDSDGGVGDGLPYPDISGGMVYFIGDGKSPLPYSDIYIDRNGIEDNKIPENGELIAFYGEFEAASVRGTEVGSMISAQGLGLDNNEDLPKTLIKGMAPDSKLISIRGGTPFEAWYFAVEGYDGIVGNSDEARIVAVTSQYPVAESGWDIYSKAADYIGTFYAEGKTIFVAGVGDDGFGYGTASSPSSSNALISVGTGTQFDYRNYFSGSPGDLVRKYSDFGPNTHYGDVLPSSSRGPNMLGHPVPDVVTAGAFLFGAIPLNADQVATTPSVFEWFGGQWAWDLWSGSSLAASSTAGILALIFDAYYQANNVYPDIETARSLLRSGADNLNYDILSQGAGYTNADRSTKMAAELGGIYLDNTYWVPGDYRGVRYEGFVKLMEPGETATQDFTLTNMDPTKNSTINVYDAVFQKFGHYEMPINITRTYDDKDIPGIINIEPYIAAGTELLKITIVSQAIPQEMNTHMAELFDWTDTNGNGKIDFPDEQNRMGYVAGTNVLELRYRDPLGRVHDGLALQIKEWGSVVDAEKLDNWIINLDFYSKEDWSHLDLLNAPDQIAHGESKTFTAQLNVPADAVIGSYEGAIYIEEREPDQQVAVGVGIFMENISFLPYDANPITPDWTYNAVKDITVAILDDYEVRFGNRSLVQRSTSVNMNGTLKAEGIDYTVSQYQVSFNGFVPIDDRNATTISYLTVEAVNGNPIEEATWTAVPGIPNFVKDSVNLTKDGVPWDETEDVTNENVTWASGGELQKPLVKRNVVRGSINLTKNGTHWPQFGGEVTEYIIDSAYDGQKYADLQHGNVIPGSAEVLLNGIPMLQTGEVTIMEKEEVDPLNSTEESVVGETFAVVAPPGDKGAIWNDTGTWYGKFLLNGDDMPDVNGDSVPDFTIISYNIYEDGIPFTDGLDFQMHTGGTHGKLKFMVNLDPGNHTYTASYIYFNNTKKIGYLAHGNVVSESYTIYIDGQTLEKSKYVLDLETGKLNLTQALEPNQLIEAVYQYSIFVVDGRTGNITLTDGLVLGDNVTVKYSYNNYNIELMNGILTFANGLSPGDRIAANYSFANYVFNMPKGIIQFVNPLKPNETVNCTYSHYNNLIPIFYNIGADQPNFTFGGDVVGTNLYNNNEITGGYGFEGGDRRYYYLDVREQGSYEYPRSNQRLYVDVEWQNNVTDIDVQVYGRTPIPNMRLGLLSKVSFPSDVYGPHSVHHVGGSDETSDFLTTTGGPEEIVAPPISGGLNVVALHAVRMNGSSGISETFNARVGTMYVDPAELEIVTNKLNGEQKISMHSNIEWKGVGGIAGGPSAPEELRNQTVKQDNPDWSSFPSFTHQMASGKTIIERTIKDCLIFDVHIWGHTSDYEGDHSYKDVVDLDLAVFLDVPPEGSDEEEGDGIPQVEEIVAIDADSDADEHVKLIAPKDGTYLIVVFGFTLKTDPAHYDVDITIVQGTGFTLSGKGVNDLPDEYVGKFSSSQIENPFNITHLTIGWDLPGSTTGSLQGALYIGPGNGPMAMLIPVELTIDTDPPLITNTQPGNGAYVSDNKQDLVVALSDLLRGELDPSSVKVFLDGQEITAQSSITIPFDSHHDEGGYPVGTVYYEPSVPLQEGGHVATVRVSDIAGNMAIKTWSFTVDTGNPLIEFTNPSEKNSFTNTAEILVTGKTEIQNELSLLGVSNSGVEISQDGSFKASVQLTEGDNNLVLRGTDLAGNSIEVQRTITLDTAVPRFIRSTVDSQTNKDSIVIKGEVSESGTMLINNVPASVNSDGTFENLVKLDEGLNTFHLEFTDMAGNTVDEWKNVTKDTIQPIISLTDVPIIVHNDNFTFSGQIEEDMLLVVLINGKQVTVNTTRATSEFTRTVILSYGINTIVIEAKDQAGNVVEMRHMVEYTPESGVNWTAIGMMIILLIVGLLVGIFIAMTLWREKPDEDEIPSEMPPIEDDMQPVEDEMTVSEELPSEEFGQEEGIEPIPTEEGLEEELPSEEFGQEEGIEPIPTEEGLEEELPSEEFGQEEGIEPISTEEGLEEEPSGEELQPEELPQEEKISEELTPEDIGDQILEDEVPSEEPEISTFDEVPVEEPAMAETFDEEAVVDPVVNETFDEETLAMETPVEEQPSTEIQPDEIIPEEAPIEDERIVKLKQAYEEGKISKELFEKNLQKLQEG